MGYQPKKNLYKLVFQDPVYDGFEVTCTSVPMETILWVRSLGSKEDIDRLAQGADGQRQMIDIMIGAILSWNLEDDDGNPLPVTSASLLAQDPKFVQDVLAAWSAAISGVSGPLGDGSISGPRFPEASIPMAPPSSSPPS